VTRAEMAVFLLRALHGRDGLRPLPTTISGMFGGRQGVDGTWIDQYYREGMTTGCGGGNYCPENT